MSAKLPDFGEKSTLVYKAFAELTSKGYFVVEEQNFGADWAVYKSDPDTLNNHAEYLVFLDLEARMYVVNRLATILKKKACLW